MKSYTPKTFKKREKNLDDILKTKGVKLDRGNGTIGKILKLNRGRIVKNNPQKILHKNHSSIEAYQDDSYGQKSSQQSLEKVIIPQRIASRVKTKTVDRSEEQNQPTLEINQNQILLKKARHFVNRLRKQKEYQEGKALVRRQKELQKRQKIIKQQQKVEEKEKAFFKAERYNRIMENILYHEERVSDRLKKSIDRYRTSEIRVQTEADQEIQNKRASRSTMLNYQSGTRTRQSRLELPVLNTLKKRVRMLSNMLDSIQA